MAHTTRIRATSFIHNGDPFEEGSLITIVRPTGEKMIVPMDDLVEFIGSALQDKAITEIENIDPKMFLMGRIAEVINRLEL